MHKDKRTDSLRPKCESAHWGFQPPIARGSVCWAVQWAGMMFWKKANGASAPESASTALSVDDAALDALVHLLKAFGDNAFDTDNVSAPETRAECHGWAQKVSVGGGKSADAEPRARQGLQAGLRRGPPLFFGSTRARARIRRTQLGQPARGRTRAGTVCASPAQVPAQSRRWSLRARTRAALAAFRPMRACARERAQCP